MPLEPRTGALLAFVVLMLWGAASGQGQAPAGALVRTTTRLVQISVIARDKKGEPVEDLTAADFVVLDNGHSQKIQIFRKETNELPTKLPAALPPDTYTNQFQQSGTVAASVTILLLDGLNTEITDQAFARQQVIKFLQQIQPGDRLAIYTLGRNLRVLQGLTGDSSKLVAALGKYSGQSTMDLAASTPTQLQTGNDTTDAILQDAFQREANMYIQERVEITVAALMEIANHAGALPGRKNLLWVSGSFPFSVEYENLQDVAKMVDDPKSEGNLSNEQLLFAEDIERAARALTDANIAVYPVDARGLLGLNMNTAKNSSKTAGYGAMNNGSPSGGMLGGNPGGVGHGRGGGGGGGGLPGARPSRRGQNQKTTAGQSPDNPILNPDHTTFETMDALAEGTGGKAFYNSNDISASLHTAMDDSRVTYELGYYPADVQWDGSFHTVSVEVKKPDVVVRARKGYFALPEPAPTPEVLRGIVTNASVSPLESTGLGVAVRVKATNNDLETTMTAMIFFDPRSIQFDFKDEHFAGSANIVLVQLDSNHQILSAAQQSFPLSFSTSQYKQFLKQQVELTQQVNLVPKAAELRVVLCDGKTGKVGSVAVPLAKYLSTNAAGH